MMLQMMAAMPLCSRCAKHELNSWINEKLLELDPEVTMQIREELKDVELRGGECIVCRSQNVSYKFFERILKIFEKHEVSHLIIDEFKKNFFY